VYRIFGAEGTWATWDHAQKKTKRYREQKPEQVAQYLAQIAGVPKSHIAYADETGIDAYVHREYGWSKRGIPVIGKISGRKFKRTSIVAAQIGKAIISPLQYEGTMDSSLFETWFEFHLLPSLPKNAFIVMDNASFHRKSRLHPLAQSAGMTLIFLPPYSPELNPIEHFWSWLKRHLRKILPQYATFDDALCAAFQGQ
jgi:transposase